MKSYTIDKNNKCLIKEYKDIEEAVYYAFRHISCSKSFPSAIP